MTAVTPEERTGLALASQSMVHYTKGAEMATESAETASNDSTEETSGQQVSTQGTEENATSETEGNGGSQDPTPQQEQRLPDDHPLVKTLAAQKEELKELRTAGQRVKDLEAQVADLTSKAQSGEAIQAKYDRLEEFVIKAGGPLGKALDSRSFSTKLFETDTSIDDLVKEWYADNPSATSKALSAQGGGEGKEKHSVNDLLRAAAK